NFNDFSGDVAPGNVRQLHAGKPLAHPEIEVLHGASFHTYENLVFARLWIGNIFVSQNFRAAEFMNADGFHRHSYTARSPISNGNGRFSPSTWVAVEWVSDRNTEFCSRAGVSLCGSPTDPTP